MSAVSSQPVLDKGGQLQSAHWPGMCSLSWVPRVLLSQYSRFRSRDKEPTPPAPDHHAGGTPGLGLTAPGRAPELGEPLHWYRPRTPEPPREQDSRPVSSPATQHHPVPRSCLAISSEAPRYL